MTADSAAVIIDTSHAIKNYNELENQLIGRTDKVAASQFAKMQ